MRETLILLLVGLLALVPAVASDSSDAVNRYDIVFFDLDDHSKWSCEVKEGDTIADTAPYIWNLYPYWIDIDTGYWWKEDYPVTCDLHLHASETEPPTKPEPEPDLLPYVGLGIAAFAVVGAGVYLVGRRA